MRNPKLLASEDYFPTMEKSYKAEENLLHDISK
jgi:hypothetical protein